jgi:hypothetical protein
MTPHIQGIFRQFPLITTILLKFIKNAKNSRKLKSYERLFFYNYAQSNHTTFSQTQNGAAVSLKT